MNETDDSVDVKASNLTMPLSFKAIPEKEIPDAYEKYQKMTMEVR